MDTLQHSLDKAKIALMARADSAFFTTVCFSLKMGWDDTLPTAATNGVWIRFNPQFFMNLSVEERVFLLIHESMHVAFLHMGRLADHEPRKWNVAADHVINLMLIERGFKMPKNGLADPQYKGMSTEEVYALLPNLEEQAVDCDLVAPDGKPEDFEKEVQDILVRASIQSKLQNDAEGSIPGSIQIFLNGLLNPKLPWNVILQKFLHAMTKDNYSFRRLNRRFFPQYYLPSLYSERLANIAVAVDTSGSVSDEDFKAFISETHSVLRMMKPEKISFIQFDTTIKSVDEIHDVHELSRVKFTGRGGTYITPVINWVNQNKPQLLLVFSDGEFRFMNTETKIPVIWLIHENAGFKAPFGKTIHYTL